MESTGYAPSDIIFNRAVIADPNIFEENDKVEYIHEYMTRGTVMQKEVIEAVRVKQLKHDVEHRADYTSINQPR